MHFFCHKKNLCILFFPENDLGAFSVAKTLYTFRLEKILRIESCHLESSDFWGLCVEVMTIMSYVS